MSPEENLQFAHVDLEKSNIADLTKFDHLLLVGIGFVPFVIATIHHYITF